MGPNRWPDTFTYNFRGKLSLFPDRKAIVPLRAPRHLWAPQPTMCLPLYPPGHGYPCFDHFLTRVNCPPGVICGSYRPPGVCTHNSSLDLDSDAGFDVDSVSATLVLMKVLILSPVIAACIKQFTFSFASSAVVRVCHTKTHPTLLRASCRALLALLTCANGLVERIVQHPLLQSPGHVCCALQGWAICNEQ